MNGDFSQKLNQVLSNPAMMAQIKALADTMTESEARQEPSGQILESTATVKSEPVEASAPLPEKISVPPFFTPSPSFEKNMKNTCVLLNALKPFLDERRCAKIDKMLSMIQFAQMAGQLGNFF
jgi:hypothetical protein